MVTFCIIHIRNRNNFLKYLKNRQIPYQSVRGPCVIFYHCLSTETSFFIFALSYGVASGSEISPCNKTDNRFGETL